MKSLLKYIAVAMSAMVLFTACDKADVLPYYGNGSAVTLTSNTNNIAAIATDSNNTALTLTWTAPKYATDSNTVKYVVQIDSTGRNFSKAVTKTVTGGHGASFTAKELNNILIGYGLFNFSAIYSMDVRVISSYGNNNEPYTSNTLTFKIKPYRVIINYPSLYVPGDYQAWTPATAPTLASVANDKKYEGYVNVAAGGTFEFKLNSDPDWAHVSYGGTSTITGTSVSGVLNTSGANLKFPSSNGYYKINADVNAGALTWSATKTTWGLIGDAPAGSNWSADIPMTYNATTQVWTATIAMSAGEFKFRANSDWGINFGDNTPTDGVPDYGGSNLKITAAGNYTITLDLHIPGNYVYTITKN